MRIFNGFEEFSILITESKAGILELESKAGILELEKNIWQGVSLKNIYETKIWIHNNKINKNNTKISNEILIDLLMNK